MAAPRAAVRCFKHVHSVVTRTLLYLWWSWHALSALCEVVFVNQRIHMHGVIETDVGTYEAKVLTRVNPAANT